MLAVHKANSWFLTYASLMIFALGAFYFCL